MIWSWHNIQRWNGSSFFFPWLRGYFWHVTLTAGGERRIRILAMDSVSFFLFFFPSYCFSIFHDQTHKLTQNIRNIEGTVEQRCSNSETSDGGTVKQLWSNAQTHSKYPEYRRNSGTEMLEQWNIWWWNSETIMVKRTNSLKISGISKEQWNRDARTVKHLMVEQIKRTNSLKQG